MADKILRNDSNVSASDTCMFPTTLMNNLGKAYKLPSIDNMGSVEAELWNIFTYYTLHGNALDPGETR